MPPSSDRSSRLESAAFYILLATAFLVPLAFWPTPYFALEAVKTILIAVGTLASAACFLILAIKEKSLRLPPKSIVWTTGLLALSLIVSSIASGHFSKSFFGQGFELSAGSFLILLVVAGWTAFTAVSRRADRVIVLYAGIAGSFLILFLLHFLRFFLGAGFASLGVMNAVTSTIAGNWYALAIYSVVVLIIAAAALVSLPLSSRMKIVYWALAAVAGFFAIVINSSIVWWSAAAVFFVLALLLSSFRTKKVAWIPAVICLIALIFAWKGTSIATPVVTSLNAGYAEIALPWQLTLDIASGELKQQPLFGAGPNRFSQAFLTYKPAVINPTDAWSIEFNSGFGLLPTYVVTQGLVGSVLWVLFFVFLCLVGVRALRPSRQALDAAMADAGSAPAEPPYARFVLISSWTATAFLWLIAIFYVPPHVILYLAFVFTGISLGAAVAYGRLASVAMGAIPGSAGQRMVPAVSIVLVIVAAAWALIYVKNTAALAYFGQGVKSLTISNDPAAADSAFAHALALNPMDVYWQGRAEAAIAAARNQIATASGTQADSDAAKKAVADASATIKVALGYAEKAVESDPSNYYNYVSQARVAEAASSINMAGGYDTAVQAYTNAIRLNPLNPSLYVSLSRLQASTNKLDDALQTVGAALQVKNNYLDAVFLLAQIEVAKGNMPDAITAAKFAVQLNPQNPLLQFQLGLFQYSVGQFADAAATLAEAVKIQPDYANAQYFLGLSLVRLGKTADAVAVFEQLAASNPDNQEVAFILSNLKSGKSPFTNAQPPITPSPEKRATPPLPEKSQQ